MNRKDYKAMFSQVQSIHSAHSEKLEVIMNRKSANRTHKKPVMVLLALLLVALLSVSVYAIATLLSPAEVAREIGDNALAKAFEDGEGTIIGGTAVSDGYIITLQGMTSGKNILEYVDENAEQNAITFVDAERTAIIFSVQREDGNPVRYIDQDISFMPCVFFSGYKPWMVNSMTLGSGGQTFEKDGVFYMVVEIDENIEMFADRTVYCGIWDASMGFPGSAVFTMGGDGTITFVDGLQKAHAMFTLPLDPDWADPARVERIIEEMGISKEDLGL